jgi:hypothetical protein
MKKKTVLLQVIIASLIVGLAIPSSANAMDESQLISWAIGSFANDQEISTTPGFYPAGEIELPDNMGRGVWTYGNPLRVPNGTKITLDFRVVDVAHDLRELSLHVTSIENPLIDSLFIEVKEVEDYQDDRVHWIYRNGDDPHASPYLTVEFDTTDWPTGLVSIYPVLTYSVPKPETLGFIPNGSNWVPGDRAITVEMMSLDEFLFQASGSSTVTQLAPSASTVPAETIRPTGNSPEILIHGESVGDRYSWDGLGVLYITLSTEPIQLTWRKVSYDTDQVQLDEVVREYGSNANQIELEQTRDSLRRFTYIQILYSDGTVADEVMIQIQGGRN